MVRVLRQVPGKGYKANMRQLHRMRLCTATCYICAANRKKKMEKKASAKRRD